MKCPACGAACMRVATFKDSLLRACICGFMIMRSWPRGAPLVSHDDGDTMIRVGDGWLVVGPKGIPVGGETAQQWYDRMCNELRTEGAEDDRD